MFNTENKTFLLTVKLKYLPTRLMQYWLEFNTKGNIYGVDHRHNIKQRDATYGFLYIIISYILQKCNILQENQTKLMRKLTKDKQFAYETSDIL